MLVAVLDPAHRPADPTGEERDQEILGIDMALDAEAAADVGRDTAHPPLRQLENPGGLPAHPVHHLGRGPDRHGLRARIVDADHAPAFHGHAAVAVMIEPPPQRVRRAGQSGLDVALVDGELADDVGAQLLMDEGSTRPYRLLCVDDGRQRLQVDRDELGRVLGGVAALRHHHGDRLADVTHLVGGKERLLRIVQLVAHVGLPLGRQRELGIRHRRQQLQKLGAAHHQGNAGRGGGGGRVHRPDAGVRHRTAHEGHVEHAGEDQIRHVLALAGEEPLILPPQDGLPDEATGTVRRHVFASAAARILAAADMTARTILR